MKVCTKCNIEKEETCFRRKKNKFCKNGFYFSGKCIVCENLINKEYRIKRSGDENFKQASRERTKKYQQTNKGKLKKEEYRKSDKCKKKQHEWYIKTKDKRLQYSKERVRKIAAQLSDEYIINLLTNKKQKVKLLWSDVKNNKELIEITRVKLLTKRIKKSIENISNKGVCVSCNNLVDKSEFKLVTHNGKQYIKRECNNCRIESSKINWQKYKNKLNGKKYNITTKPLI